MNQRTLQDLKNDIDKLLQEHPEYGKLPLIYASDDEGNSYHQVISQPTPAQVHDLDVSDVELVGFAYSESVAPEDINAICIN